MLAATFLKQILNSSEVSHTDGFPLRFSLCRFELQSFPETLSRGSIPPSCPVVKDQPKTFATWSFRLKSRPILGRGARSRENEPALVEVLLEVREVTGHTSFNANSVGFAIEQALISPYEPGNAPTAQSSDSRKPSLLVAKNGGAPNTGLGLAVALEALGPPHAATLQIGVFGANGSFWLQQQPAAAHVATAKRKDRPLQVGPSIKR